MDLNLIKNPFIAGLVAVLLTIVAKYVDSMMNGVPFKPADCLKCLAFNGAMVAGFVYLCSGKVKYLKQAPTILTDSFE